MTVGPDSKAVEKWFASDAPFFQTLGNWTLNSEDQNVDRAAVAGSQARTGKWIGVRYVDTFQKCSDFRHFQTTHCAEAWHNWLSLDFEKVYGLPGNAMRHYCGALAMKSVTSHRFRCLGKPGAIEFHTWVGKWPTNSPVEIQLLLRWSCMKQLPYPWDWQMLIFLDTNVRCRKLQAQHDCQDCLS